MSSGEDDTRERLLGAARLHFAARGFYGASLAQIAAEEGLTKQALLYHFKRKEDLYAEVLRQISARLLAALNQAVRDDAEPSERFENMFVAFHLTAREDPTDTRILMRELLDNQARAESAKDWYLTPLLDGILTALREVPGFEAITFERGFAIIYQLLGANEYFAISEPTLRRMYGGEKYDGARNAFPRELRAQIRRLIKAGNQ